MADTTYALITGANKGLGFAAAHRLGTLGWTVLVGGRDAERGAEAAAKLVADGLAAELVVLDVTSEESVRSAAREVSRRFGRLDVLVNNAGVIGPRVDALETGPDELLACYATNVFGPVRVTQAFVPLLRRSANPRMVTSTATPARRPSSRARTRSSSWPPSARTAPRAASSTAPARSPGRALP